MWLGMKDQDFSFADGVSFQLGSLSVEALERDSSNCDTCEQCHRIRFMTDSQLLADDPAEPIVLLFETVQ